MKKPLFIVPTEAEETQATSACETHGPYTARKITMPLLKNPLWSRCPACQADDEAHEKIKAQEKAQEEQRQRLALSGIPTKFIGCSFETFQANTATQQQVLKTVMAFSKDFAQHLQTGTGLIFSGPPGTGKTHLALALAQSLLGHYTARYETASRIIRQVRATWSGKQGLSEHMLFESLCQIDCLIVDEIGARYDSEGEKIILFDLIDERYLAAKPTLLISNLGPQELKTALGVRSYDRLRETSHRLAFDWVSHRGQSAVPYLEIV